MTDTDRARAVAGLGFTERQAQFLVKVLLHSGVCVVRQYCAFRGIVRGQKTQDFFSRLVARRYATVYTRAHGHARIFHVHHRLLYDAIGEPHSRFRKPVPVGRCIERLMLLDAVLSQPDLTWLATERDKVAHFTLLLRDRLRPNEFPHLRFGTGRQMTVRYFADKMPIGVDADRRVHTFCYLVARGTPIDFREFLARHAELLRSLPEWSVRLLIPGYLRDARDAYSTAWEQELATPLRLGTAEELRWFFEVRQRRDAGSPNRECEVSSRYEAAAGAFGGPRFRRLYRRWLKEGQPVIDAAVSPVLADAIVRGSGRLECHELPHSYLHLSPLASTA